MTRGFAARMLSLSNSSVQDFWSSLQKVQDENVLPVVSYFSLLA
jgi:hypothetical protein